MQINFYTTKENFIELYEWMKKKFNNLKYYYSYSDKCFDEKNFYLKTVGHIGQLILIDEEDLLTEKRK